MSEDTRHGHYLRTYTGRKFYVDNPQVEDVHIEDIAHALAICNRFAGHTTVPYSVAQHSVMIARTFAPGSLERKWALLHDAAEAYIGDMTRPLKKLGEMDGYAVVEDCVMEAIRERFGLAHDSCPQKVKDADLAMLRSEQRDLVRGAEGWRNAPCLYPGGAVKPWPWWEAEAQFLIEFEALWPDFGYEGMWPLPTLLQVSGDDMLRLLQENSVLREFRDETHRRETARVEGVRVAAPVDQRKPYDPADEWDAVAAELREMRGGR